MSENLGKTYVINNLYDAIQMVKELPAADVFEIWEKLNKGEAVFLTGVDKQNLKIYIENLKYYNPDLAELFAINESLEYEKFNSFTEKFALHEKEHGVSEEVREREKRIKAIQRFKEEILPVIVSVIASVMTSLLIFNLFFK